MDDHPIRQPTDRPSTAALLETLRTRRQLSKQRLAELADVSATYVRNIEAGFDESGRAVIPSANVIQKLARGLSRAEPDEARRAEEERQAYVALMAAAGYLPTEASDLSSETPTPSLEGAGAASRGVPPRISQPARSDDGRRLIPDAEVVDHFVDDVLKRSPDAPTSASREVVMLRDRRLARHLRDLLDNWEALASEDQALLLGIAEFVADRRRRREGLTR